MKINKTYYWVHGDHHRQATIKKISSDGQNVLLDGESSVYWMRKSTLKKKINKQYPRGLAI